MCLGIPGRVVAMVPGHGDQLATVDVMGVSRQVNVGMLEDGPVTAGDWVMIHMGFALERVDATRAAQAMDGLELMGSGPADNATEASPKAQQTTGLKAQQTTGLG